MSDKQSEHEHYLCVPLIIHYTLKVEYHANENQLKNSEKIVYIGERLMYPIIKNNNSLTC